MASIRQLVAQRDLGLTLRSDAATADRAISWASSSDLLDPTPFLVADQLLLTTGLQFGDDAGDEDYRAYAGRLAEHGVLGIGFGTEVLRAGTPEGLIAACDAAGLPLVEVPYRTPFLAIIRRVARDVEREVRARDDWTLSSLRAISAAALPRGDVAAVLRELAGRLGARVTLFDADCGVEFAQPARRAAPDPEIVTGVERLLAGGVRAADEVGAADSPTVLQTIGPSGEPAGVLAVSGPRLDRAARTVLAAAVALVEVSVAATRQTSRAGLARNGVLLRLLRDGRGDLAAELAAAAGVQPPANGVVVSATPPDPATVTAVAEREARGDDRIVVAEHGRLLCLVPVKSVAATVARLAAAGGTVGSARVQTFAELEAGIARADAARRAASPGVPVVWEDLPPGGGVEAMAARLPAIAATEAGAAQLAAAENWFDENCAWGPAARRLGLHPHTVRDRVAALAGSLGTSIDDFDGRARLWAALRASRLGTPPL